MKNSRIDFGAAFFQVRQEIKKRQLDLEEVKLLLCDCLTHYKSQFSDKNLLTTVEDKKKFTFYENGTNTKRLILRYHALQ